MITMLISHRNVIVFNETFPTLNEAIAKLRNRTLAPDTVITIEHRALGKTTGDVSREWHNHNYVSKIKSDE